MDPHLEQQADDTLTKVAADTVQLALDKVDGKTESAIVLQIIGNTAMFGLADLLAPAIVAQWLRDSAIQFDSLAAKQAGELN